MATRVQRIVEDDFDRSTDGIGTYRFALEGTEYEINLAEHNLERLAPALRPFIAAGRRLGATVSDRFAALLVLLYAQPVSRIARLTTGHLREAGGITPPDIGTEPLQLPSPRADLAARLPERRPVGMAGDLHTNQWLFPGRRPDLPTDPVTLMRRLNALGIHACDTRNTAMLQLAAELPAVVMADLLGVHIGTATKWVHESSGNWPTTPPTAPTGLADDPVHLIRA